MKLEEIRNYLTSIDDIVGDWLAGKTVSVMEKDIALEKMRRVYEAIKAISTHEASLDTMPDVNRFMVPSINEYPQSIQEEQDKALDSDTILEEINETVEVSDDNIADSSRSKSNRKALLSLYDDCPAAEKAPQDQPHEKGGEIKPQPVPVTSIPKEIFEEMRHEPMHTREPYIPEAYVREQSKERQVQEPECSPKPVTDEVKTLRSEITANDRFKMIRDMFDSDAEAYERAMDRFDSFTDLDDAVVYMYENFNWNPNDESVKTLVELLTQKLA